MVRRGLRLVAEYMENHGRTLNWAMAGRSAENLPPCATRLGRLPRHRWWWLMSDRQSVRDMVARGKVICTTVGPYQLYGSDIVAARAELGTDYADLSGEPGWMHEMIGAHNEQAAHWARA